MDFCALCESKQPTLQRFWRNNTAIVQCQTCGLLFASPMPSAEVLKDFYCKDSSGSNIQAYTKRPHRSFVSRYIQDSRIRRDFRILKSFERIQKGPGKILDFGCGIGMFLNHARERGWDAWGIDLDPERIAYGKKQFGLNLFQGELETHHFPKETFDVVTLRNVLDHLASPQNTLKEIQRILKKTGLVFINVHDVQGWRAQKYKETWNALWPPLHLHYFSHQTLERMLEKAGLKFYRVPGVNLKEGIKLLAVRQDAPYQRSTARKVFEKAVYTLVQKLHFFSFFFFSGCK